MPIPAYCCQQDEAKRAEDTARLREELQQAVQDASDVQEMYEQADARQSADAVRAARRLRRTASLLAKCMPQLCVADCFWPGHFVLAA